jgi:hypothetical protein
MLTVCAVPAKGGRGAPRSRPDGREVSRQTGTTTYEDLAGKLQALVAAP